MVKKTSTKFPKFYICKYGAFYEGQLLAEYCWSNNDNYYYNQTVLLEKFIIHYYDYYPYIYFKVRELDTKKAWTFPCNDYLGIIYRKLK